MIRASYEALPEGGESLIDEERRVNAPGLIRSLNMLIGFGDALDYTGAEFREWGAAAGFRRVETLHLTGPVSAATAWKKAADPPEICRFFMHDFPGTRGYFSNPTSSHD